MTKPSPDRSLPTVPASLARSVAVLGIFSALAACTSMSKMDTQTVSIDRDAALRSVNAFRAEHGMPALSIDARLMAAAAAQSQAMAARGRMDHAVAGELSDRVRSAGYAWGTTAENIAKDYRSFDGAMKGWIASTGHRRNLLNPSVTEIGFAAARAADGRPYWTEIFAAPSRFGEASGITSDGRPRAP